MEAKLQTAFLLHFMQFIFGNFHIKSPLLSVVLFIERTLIKYNAQ
ncbi:hypothetical protein LHGZ1_1277 [Laribacter hongkongensis]|uniref:Uncharacterized protein n=1 Tax=Laribacter hongkongensis TaxID=168471 RepID=A0A248LH75_9NEIS|nr:hypothetical protein LHGZ1_1277 [Laribacter hongkongensis]